LESIQSAQPEDIAVLLEESFRLCVVTISDCDYRQYGCGHITQEVIAESIGIGPSQRTHPDPSGENRVYFDRRQARNDNAALRLPKDGFDEIGPCFGLVKRGKPNQNRSSR
jgi:hypothetical protein